MKTLNVIMTAVAAAVMATGAAAGEPSIGERIAECAAQGGGRVTVARGSYLSRGPIVMKSNVELHLEEGAVIEFSDDPRDYEPGVPVSWEGNQCYNISPLVYAKDCENVSITGKGVFKPRLGTWLKWNGRRDAECDAAAKVLKNDWAQNDVPIEGRQLWRLKGAKFRPQFLMFWGCRNVKLEDFSVKGTPFWTLHLYLCRGVLARGLDIDAYDDAGNWLYNSDGIDIECTRDVLVENCTFHQHDDAIVIKSGKDRDGRRTATPTENVTVRNCTVRGGPTFCAIGSELSGGVRNITVEDCRVTGTMKNIVHIKTNPRRGGFVDGVTVRNVDAKDVEGSLLLVTTLYFYGCTGEERTDDELLTPIRNITIDGISAGSVGRSIFIRGDAKLPVEGVAVDRLRPGKAEKPDEIHNVRGLRIDGREVEAPVVPRSPDPQYG